MNKLIYTEADTEGCTLKAPDYSECKNCIFHFEDTPNTCPAYPEQKPVGVLYDGHKCNKKRTE
jgi:hypothetical protein